MSELLKDVELRKFMSELKMTIDNKNGKQSDSDGLSGDHKGKSDETDKNNSYSEEVKLLDVIKKRKEEISKLESELKDTYSKQYIEKSRENNESSKERTAFREAIKDQIDDRKKLLSLAEKEHEFTVLERKNEIERKQVATERHLAEEKHYENVGKLLEKQRELEEEHYNQMRNIKAKFYSDNSDKIQELNKLEEELEEGRQAKQLRHREHMLKVERKNTDKEGRNNARSQSEFAKKLDKLTGEWKNSTGGAKAGLVGDIANKGVAKFSSFMNKDKVSISDVGGKMAEIAGNFGGVGKIIGSVIQLITAAIEQYDKINKAASDYARNVGGGKAKMADMKKLSTQVAWNLSEMGGKAYKFDKILEHTAKLSEGIGRVMDHMSEQDFKSLEDLTQWGISTETMKEYDTFGLSVETIDKKIASIYKTSGKNGLNAKAVTDQVTKNLKLAQQFTFQGGLKALERMAQKATALKIDMSAASGFAEKVSTFEGAAQTGAQLSVLGGNYAKLSNPLSLLYGGVQDEEEIFNAMLKMTKGTVKWDSKKGHLDMSAQEKLQMKAAAQAMGVDFSSLWTQAMNQGRIERINEQLGNRNIDNETREYIQNIAQLDSAGTGYVTFHGENGEERRVDVNKLTDNDKEQLKNESIRYSQEQADKVGTILKDTRTITEQLNDVIDTLKAGILRGLNNLVEFFISEETVGSIHGLNDDNSKYYAQLVRDYRIGGLDKNNLASIKSLGLTEEEFLNVKNKKLSNDQFKELMQQKILLLQTEKGLTKNINETGRKVKNTSENGRKVDEYTYGSNSWTDSNGKTINTSTDFIENETPVNTSRQNPSKSNIRTSGNSSYTSVYSARNGNNPTNSMTVSETNTKSNSNDNPRNNNTNNEQRLKVDPLNINFSGKIDLMANNTLIGKILCEELAKDGSLRTLLIKELNKGMNQGIYFRGSMAETVG